MPPFLADIEVIGTPLSYVFAAFRSLVLLVGGTAVVAIFGTVRDKTSRWAERILGGVLLAILTAGLLCLLGLMLVFLVL